VRFVGDTFNRRERTRTHCNTGNLRRIGLTDYE
jgi:hypothetical protein